MPAAQRRPEPLFELLAQPLGAAQSAGDVVADVGDGSRPRGRTQQVVERQHAPGFRGRDRQAAADIVQGAARDPPHAILNGVKCGPDGVRTDVYGNVWIASNAGRNVGYSGVTVWNPEGKLLGRIRIPEVVGNITFGGPKRNRLFMAGSQSLYAVYTAVQGSSPS